MGNLACKQQRKRKTEALSSGSGVVNASEKINEIQTEGTVLFTK